MKKLIASTLLAAAIVGGGTAVAGAAPAPTTTQASPQSGQAHHPRRHRVLRAAVITSAKALDMKPKDLVAELKAGKSVADVAKAKGVDIAKVKDALTAKGTAAIDKALAAGKINADQAAKAKARLPKAIEKFVNFHKGDHKPAGG